MGDSGLLLAEEVLLVSLDDESGKPGWTFNPATVNGALICDLIESGAVAVDAKKKVRRSGRRASGCTASWSAGPSRTRTTRCWSPC